MLCCPECQDPCCGSARLRRCCARLNGRRSAWLQITCPVALVDRNLASAAPETREAAEAFARHLFTPVAQREFTACGFRSAVREVAAESGRTAVRKVWDVESRLGDWISVQKKFFDEGVSGRPAQGGAGGICARPRNRGRCSRSLPACLLGVAFGRGDPCAR